MVDVIIYLGQSQEKKKKRKNKVKRGTSNEVLFLIENLYSFAEKNVRLGTYLNRSFCRRQNVPIKICPQRDMNCKHTKCSRKELSQLGGT